MFVNVAIIIRIRVLLGFAITDVTSSLDLERKLSIIGKFIFLLKLSSRYIEMLFIRRPHPISLLSLANVIHLEVNVELFSNDLQQNITNVLELEGAILNLKYLI